DKFRTVPTVSAGLFSGRRKPAPLSDTSISDAVPVSSPAVYVTGYSSAGWMRLIPRRSLRARADMIIVSRVARGAPVRTASLIERLLRPGRRACEAERLGRA